MNGIILLRNYMPDDAGALALLTTELGYATSLADMKLRMELMQPLHDYKTVVAVIDNDIVGYIGLHKSYYWEQNGCFVRIQALIVSDKYRRTGIGQSLIKQAELWAAETGVVNILLNCGERPQREAAHKFYAALGFERKSIGYVKSIV